jgi:methylenetetrahydrofolate reductase (NADPH)
MAAPTISFEFFPPKDREGEARLWATMMNLRSISPDFVSVTYGAGGSTRDRTIEITTHITERTSIPTVAHLTCVGSTQEEISQILTRYRDAGIKSILALRGDPPGGPSSEWMHTPNGLDHADELVALAAEFGDFKIGVAAFPDGHPASHGNFDQDINVLVRKEELGASFATTQFFFDVDRWILLVKRLKERGSQMPIIPGILPISSVKQLVRMADLGGTPIPEDIHAQFIAIESDPVAVKALGVEIATQLCKKLLDAGAPGLHFYTMNTSTATREIWENLGLRK